MSKGVALLSLLLVTSVLASCAIRDPTWAVPATVSAGGTFRLEVTGKVVSAYIEKGNSTYPLEVVRGVEGLEARVGRAPPGLYDLVVKTDEGTCVQPNAVWVVDDLRSLTLMHVTDTHIGVFTDRPAREYLMASVIIANSDPAVQLVVNTGDLADTSMPSQYETARELLTLLLKPLFVVPGNHDSLGLSDVYSEMVGPRRWYRAFGDFLFLGIDTGAEGFISLAQAHWAYSVLTSSEARDKVVLFHHPLFAYVYPPKPHFFIAKSWERLYQTLLSKPPRSKYPYVYKSWLGNEAALKTFVKGLYDGKVLLTLSGHIHVDSYAEVETSFGKTYFVATTTQGGPVRKGDYHGFRLITIGKGEVEFSGLGKPWDRHASYSLEGVRSHYVFSREVSAVTFQLTDPRLKALLPRLILAVWASNDGYSVYAPGALKVWKECSPIGCVYYAEYPSPKLNEVYLLAAYQKDDVEPPKVRAIVPKEVSPYKPFQLRFLVTDDGWGVAQVEVKLSGVTRGDYVLYSQTNEYKLNVFPIKKKGTLNVTVSVMDFKGHVTEKSFQLEVGGGVGKAVEKAPKGEPFRKGQPLPLPLLLLLSLVALVAIFAIL